MSATETVTIAPPLCEVLPPALFAKVPELYPFSPCVTEQQKCQDFVDTVIQLNGYYHNVLKFRSRLQHTQSLTVPGRFGMADHEVPQEALTAYRDAGSKTLLKLDAILVSMRPLVERVNDEKRLVERLHDSD
ncbi:hypothetical protein Q9189_002393 [Teloschistes chrysophthalmus]